MQSFRAFRIHQEAGKIVSRMETIGLNDLAEGEVVVKVRYSTINYKDALAATGAGKILRRYPLGGGIDLAGEVVSSSDPQFPPGQKVLAIGISWHDYTFLLVGGVLLAVAWVMAEATRLAQEHAEFV